MPCTTLRHKLIALFLAFLAHVPWLVPPAPAQNLSEEEINLKLQEMEQRLESLSIEEATGSVQSATSPYHTGQLYQMEQPGLPPGTEFEGSIRLGLDYERFISQSVVSNIGDNAGESLRRLDELLDQVEEIVQRSGNAEAEELLRDARFYRNEAETELNAGHPDQALLNMNISESLALSAARAAGDPIARDVEQTEWDGFSELRLQWRRKSKDGSRQEFTSWSREGDEYFQQRLEYTLDLDFTGQTSFYLDSGIRWRNYQDPVFDDYLQQSVYARYRWDLNSRWSLRLQNSSDIKTEYSTTPDGGYWSSSPQAVLSYSWGSFHQLELGYLFGYLGYLASDNQEFNSERHRLQLRYNHYGPLWRINLLGEHLWRDYEQPAGEEDYRQALFDGQLMRQVTGWMDLGLAVKFHRRRYDVTGESNTGYREISTGPVAEIHWRGMLQTLRYEWTAREHREDSGQSGFNKSIGDFDDHRLALDLWWDIHDNFQVTCGLQQQWRWYRHGQTGEYEFYLPDYHPVSNFSRSSVSAGFEYEPATGITLSTSVYYSDEQHTRFEDNDLEEMTVFLEVEVEF